MRAGLSHTKVIGNAGSSSGLKVAFVLRGDARTKPGGDSSKVARYEEGLSRLGVSSRTFTDTQGLAEWRPDVVHLMNLDLPLENLYRAKQVRRMGIPVVLSSIHHNLDAQRHFYSHGDDVYYRRMARSGLSWNQASLMRERAKLVLSRGRRKASLLPEALDAVGARRRLLAMCHTHLPMSLREQEGVRAQVGTYSSAIIHQAMSFGNQAAHSTARRSVISVVGRIEPRKNQLRLLTSLDVVGAPVVFAGALNPNHRGYGDDFLSAVKSSKNCSYVGHLDRSALQQLLLQTKVYVNAAWFEVVSQADLEAASLGCAVVTTSNSYTIDYLEGHTELDPLAMVSDPDVATAAVRRQWSLGASLVRSERAHGWPDVARELAEVYAGLA